jgi:hypothetical protein
MPQSWTKSSYQGTIEQFSELKHIRETSEFQYQQDHIENSGHSISTPGLCLRIGPKSFRVKATLDHH